MLMAELLTRTTANTTNPSESESIPDYLTTSAVVYTQSDFHLTEITFNNESASSVTVTVTDRQSPARSVLSAFTIQPNSPAGFVWKGRLVPGGFAASASVGGAVVFTARGYK